MNNSDIASFLRARALPFRDLSQERILALAEGSSTGSFEAHEVVMHFGAEATHFGVVLSGAINVSALGDGGARQSLGRLQAGDTFNEMALMTGDVVLADLSPSRDARCC